MTTNSVSKERLAEIIANLSLVAGPKETLGDVTARRLSAVTPVELAGILTELLSLRTSSGGVTTGEVVTDEMVGRARKAFCAEVRQQDREWTEDSDEGEELLTSPSGDFFSLDTAIRAALSSLHAQPEGKEEEEHVTDWQALGLDVVEYRQKERGAKPPTESQPQGTGSREAVAWRCSSSNQDPNWWLFETYAEALGQFGGQGPLEPLVPLSQLQAVERDNAALREALTNIAADTVQTAFGPKPTNGATIAIAAVAGSNPK